MNTLMLFGFLFNVVVTGFNVHVGNYGAAAMTAICAIFLAILFERE